MSQQDRFRAVFFRAARTTARCQAHREENLMPNAMYHPSTIVSSSETFPIPNGRMTRISDQLREIVSALREYRTLVGEQFVRAADHGTSEELSEVGQELI